MPRFSIKDLMIATVLVAVGLLVMRLAAIDVLQNHAIVEPAAEIMSWPGLLISFYLVMLSGGAMIGAGLFFPIKRIVAGVLVGMIGSIVWMAGYILTKSLAP